jgi:HEAT repeat protein
MAKENALLALLLAAMFCCAACPIAAELEDPYLKLKTYKHGDSRAFTDSIAHAINEASGDATKLLAIERNLIAVLESPDAAVAGKQFACRMLWRIGTKASVPVLARMLADEKTSDMARFALCRNPDPSVDQALCRALTAAKGRPLIGLIHLIGERRVCEAVPTLKKIADDADDATSASAIAALGAIGGQDAYQALESLNKGKNTKVAWALLDCADRFVAEGKGDKVVKVYLEMIHDKARPAPVRAAALRGLAATEREEAATVVERMLDGVDQAMQTQAMSLVRLLPGKAVIQRFAPRYGKLSARDQLLLIPVLADTKNADAVPLMMESAGHGNDDVRLAALRGLGKLPGNERAVLFLAAAAAKEERVHQRAARESLVRLRGKGVEQAMATGMAKGNTPVRLELIRALRDRRSASATSELLKLASDADKEIRSAALDALAALAEPKDGPALVALLVKADDERTATEIGRATVAAFGKAADVEGRAEPLIDAMKGVNAVTTKAILACLPKLGGTAALETVCAAARAGDAQIRKAAVRALADWSDPAALHPLQEIAGKAKDPTWRVFALRGSLRLLQLPSERTDEQTLAFYRTTLELAEKPAEKKLVLSALGKLRQPGAIQMIQPMLRQDDVKREAALALIQVARGLAAEHREQAASALQAVQQAVKDQGVLKQARQALESVEK